MSDKDQSLDTLSDEISALKQNEQIFCNKISSLATISKKYLNQISDLQNLVKRLERQQPGQNFNDGDISKQLDDYVKEIESLQRKIVKFESERNSLVKRLNEQTKISKNLEQKVHEVENEQSQLHDSDYELSPNRKYDLTESKYKFNVINELVKSRANETYYGQDASKGQDKDEEIIALQNKIIAFNQQHIDDVRELEVAKDKEIKKLLNEKQSIIDEFNQKVEEYEHENSKILEQNNELSDRLTQVEKILDCMQHEVIINPEASKVDSSFSKPKLKKKNISKASKSSALDDSVAFEITRHHHEKSRLQIKATEFIIFPNKLISLILKSK